MNSMLETVRKLTPLNRVFCSSDYDRAIEYLQALLPLQVHTFTQPCQGWSVHPKWDLVRSEIRKNGELIYNGTSHPLATIALSSPFRGQVTLDELRRHLHTHTQNETAIPFHFRQLYQHWKRDWGFCVSQRFYDSLEPGIYDILIETNEEPGTLKILEYTHNGLYPETFVFVAHLDHPGMANDDVAGCAVGVELFRRLLGRTTKFTYKLILVQEFIGSIYYLEHSGKQNILDGVFLEMLGTSTPIALQASQHANGILENALRNQLKQSNISFRDCPFDTVISNDEMVFEAYAIPMASLSRYPYPEYHSNHDSIDIISEASLTEAMMVLQNTLSEVEEQTLVVKRFKGVPCISNPAYSLYITAEQPAFGQMHDVIRRKLRTLMEYMPLLPFPETIHRVAARFELPESDVTTYLSGWVEKQLIEFH